MSNRIESANNFLDVNGLNDIRLKSKSADKGENRAALEQVAKQFESIFMQMLLKSMRQAQEVLESDSPFNSQSTKFYRDMHDQQLAVELSNNGSLGLSDLIVRQLGGDENFTPNSVLRSDGDISHRQTAKQAKVSMNEPAVLASASNNRQQFDDSKPEPVFTEPKDFVTALSEPAKRVQQQLGVPFQVVIAQAALETGWGQKIIKTSQGNSSNNLFNIKADSRWQGDKTHKETLEFEQGTMVKKKEPFRVYDSLADSINDYIDFLSSGERYQQALQNSNNVEQFLHGIQKAGYATDPNYANKIMGILASKGFNAILNGLTD